MNKYGKNCIHNGSCATGDGFSSGLFHLRHCEWSSYKILLDEVPVVSYRVLGFLLLGVVRIYSKKVEFMFDDCRKVLVKINAFTDRKKANLTIEAICAPYLSITRPESFELDAYDLQILEDGRGVNIRPDEDIMLGDAWRNEGTEHCLFDKHNYEKDCNMEHNYEEDVDHFETCSTAYTPVKDVLSPYIMGNLVVASPSHNLSNSEASIEKIRGYDFSLGERMDPMPFGEGEEEPGLDRPFAHDQLLTSPLSVRAVRRYSDMQATFYLLISQERCRSLPLAQPSNAVIVLSSLNRGISNVTKALDRAAFVFGSVRTELRRRTLPSLLYNDSSAEIPPLTRSDCIIINVSTDFSCPPQVRERPVGFLSSRESLIVQHQIAPLIVQHRIALPFQAGLLAVKSQ
ncbi:hypothetical protein Acr_02g0013980 [Actinidia rufa]|uniref:Rad21/Rec8-like protein N-terminal domain-containing protein n=1 Tax=Actinidia rufa TaxID=165716 RepID=A0A7J0E9L2_9ERIC|nr:hypothetical protein Acr_02g0013980 [Actinidia rufa]